MAVCLSNIERIYGCASAIKKIGHLARWCSRGASILKAEHYEERGGNGVPRDSRPRHN